MSDAASARQAFLAVLQRDPTRLDALLGLAALAAADGYRSAAQTAYRQAILHHPTAIAARLALGNLLLDDAAFAEAETQFRAALAIDPECPPAHTGLGRALHERADPAAEHHLHRGLTGHAVQPQPARGPGPHARLLLLVDARGGNLHTKPWIDDHRFAVTALYPEFADPAEPLPPHDIIVNAIGDAERAEPALQAAARLVARTNRPVLNPPHAVLASTRLGNAHRLAALPGVIAPATRAVSRHALTPADLPCPILLRAPGYHTGQHFRRVDHPADLAPALAAMPGDDLLLIEPLDARGPDGLARKYRVMLIDRAPYPLHLAISPDWKVHYFTAAMAQSAAFRAEEQRFLDDMPATLGPPAMAALHAIAATLALDYAGVDFALAPDGALLLFEANATMVIAPPGPEPLWDYRRPAAAAALAAARALPAHRIDTARPVGA